MHEKEDEFKMKRVLGSIRRADEKFHLIENGDSICVGVSGGKDSVLLMEALKLYQMFSKTDFSLCAVTLDLGIVKQKFDEVAIFAESIGVPYKIVKTDIGEVVFDIRHEKSPCALCAKLRRGALNNAAKDMGCNKVALGHNREDVLETFFLSLLYEGRINTFAPVTYLSRSDVTVIRPMVFLPEKYALSVAKQRCLPVQKANCPAAGYTKREEAKKLLQYLSTFVPDIEEKMIHAIANTEKYGLWDRMRLRYDHPLFSGVPTPRNMPASSSVFIDSEDEVEGESR